MALTLTKSDAFMNLDPRDYVVKIQGRGQFKWHDTRQGELNDFLVGEASKDSRVGFLGDWMSTVFMGSTQEGVKSLWKIYANKMVNRQLRFLDVLERVAEGKSLDGNGIGSSDEPRKGNTLHSWLMSLQLANFPNKQLRIQAVTPPLWKAQYRQSKETYLYKDKVNTGGVMA
ncbi:hypothetical protein JB92DRAFT_2833807 [Gautieria morchelliformis]|nr:hypothetical protein JB92DRAFT_2833807 [Gautieria morchelliformis]